MRPLTDGGAAAGVVLLKAAAHLLLGLLASGFAVLARTLVFQALICAGGRSPSARACAAGR